MITNSSSILYNIHTANMLPSNKMSTICPSVQSCFPISNYRLIYTEMYNVLSIFVSKGIFIKTSFIVHALLHSASQPERTVHLFNTPRSHDTYP